MLHLITSNQMEQLTRQLCLRLDQGSKSKNPLADDWVVVQNPAMQHWLSMEIAEQQSIAMNIRFPLLGQVVWQMVRAVLPGLPEKSPYSRDILVWRIYALLPELAGNSVFDEPTHYWWPEHDKADPASQSALKRYQLARQLADLFEQYLLYRPSSFIKQWESGESPHWQAALWRELISEQEDHPLQWMEEALSLLNNMPERPPQLPVSMSLFGITSLPPHWLDFLSVLSEKIDITLYLLVPSQEYWLDSSSEKREAKRLREWIEKAGSGADYLEPLSHPILGTLGLQGQEFLSLIYDRIPLLNDEDYFTQATGDSILQSLQSDLLALVDRRESRAPRPVDQSVQVANCHSPIREVQALHDWLLACLDEDPTLRPKDILVMCPEIERYAPYVQAIFLTENRGDLPGSGSGSAITQLPCSIADRSLRDSHPLINSFLQLLELPDSRFGVNEVMAHLEIPCVHEQFGLTGDDLQLLKIWLTDAAVHWGLDVEHKMQLGLPARKSFTWQEGLDRLLKGFMLSDQETLYQGEVTLPWVEGANAEILGHLMHFLATLQTKTRSLKRTASVQQWQQQLLDTLENFYQAQNTQDEYALSQIANALTSLLDANQFSSAQNSIELPISVVRKVLQEQLGRPQQERHFMTGQVTFCSMQPMRSIPFRIIALLGLNDGDFPRQRQALGFDLVAQAPRQRGDRSLREDDRYQFLEALLSARDKLYLSYCGRQLKDNSPQQPSLVLNELLEYLSLAHCDTEYMKNEKGQEDIEFAQRAWIAQLETLHPLQAFDQRLFHAEQAKSYDQRWLRLLDENAGEDNDIRLSEDEEQIIELNLDTLVRFFDNPAQQFAQEKLGLYLNTPEEQLSDAEPFAADALLRYQVREEMSEEMIGSGNADSINEWHQHRGFLPDNPGTPLLLDEWQQSTTEFVEQAHELGAADIKLHACTVALGRFRLYAQLPLIESDTQETRLLYYRLAKHKTKDNIRAWLAHLMASSCDLNCRSTQSIHENKNFSFDYIDNAGEELLNWLNVWLLGQQQPIAYTGDMCLALLQLDEEERPAMWQNYWLDSNAGRQLNPYIQWFWPVAPALELSAMHRLYEPMRQHLRDELL